MTFRLLAVAGIVSLAGAVGAVWLMQAAAAPPGWLSGRDAVHRTRRGCVVPLSRRRRPDADQLQAASGRAGTRCPRLLRDQQERLHPPLQPDCRVRGRVPAGSADPAGQLARPLQPGRSQRTRDRHLPVREDRPRRPRWLSPESSLPEAGVVRRNRSEPARAVLPHRRHRLSWPGRGLHLDHAPGTRPRRPSRTGTARRLAPPRWPAAGSSRPVAHPIHRRRRRACRRSPGIPRPPAGPPADGAHPDRATAPGRGLVGRDGT
jgi:hypothetical protein